MTKTVFAWLIVAVGVAVGGSAQAAVGTCEATKLQGGPPLVVHFDSATLHAVTDGPVLGEWRAYVAAKHPEFDGSSNCNAVMNWGDIARIWSKRGPYVQADFDPHVPKTLDDPAAGPPDVLAVGFCEATNVLNGQKRLMVARFSVPTMETVPESTAQDQWRAYVAKKRPDFRDNLICGAYIDAEIFTEQLSRRGPYIEEDFVPDLTPSPGRAQRVFVYVGLSPKPDTSNPNRR